MLSTMVNFWSTVVTFSFQRIHCSKSCLAEAFNNSPSTDARAGDQFQPTMGTKMDFHQAQEDFAKLIKSVADQVQSYYWRLSGDAPNSFCQFLSLEEEELKAILRLCKVYNVESNDSFSKNNFDTLMLLCRHPTVD
jgi:hypothetical protein